MTTQLHGDTAVTRAKEMGGAFGDAVNSAKGVVDQALSAGRELGDKAKDAALSAGESLKAQTSDLADGARHLAADSKDKLIEKVDAQKRAGADYVANFAEALQRAASEFDAEVPFAASYIRSAATQVAAVAESVREGHVGDVLKRTQDFARQQPTLFAGLSMMVGFGLVRFLKSSASSPNAGDSGTAG